MSTSTGIWSRQSRPSRRSRRRWRALIRWFESQAGLSEPSFVVIGEEWLPDWEEQENLGCTFPRLVVARSQAGSLIGVAGQVVQA